MLTLSLLRENPDYVAQRLLVKNIQEPEKLIEKILETDKKKRDLQTETESLQAQMNALSKSIGTFFKEGKQKEAEEAKQKTADLKSGIKDLGQQINTVSIQLDELLIQLPNIPHESVPEGNTSEDNKEVRSGGKMPDLGTEQLPHWDLAAKYKLIDFELGNKITGAGFPVYTGKGAKLQRSLINFFLDENEKAGYSEVLPPLMVNEDSGFGTGQLPDKEGMMYHVQLENLFLVPTAEVPVTNIYRDVIIDYKTLPIKNTAYSPCFRREAGSYGKDVRGLNRLHQFDKVEIVQIQSPENSYKALDEMVVHVESIIQKLELPYRILKLCGGDMSFTSALTFDFEVYSAAQKRWLEVSSVSNFESFQANRLKLRFRDPETKKTTLAHTLNGSSLALPRIVAALLENNQTKDGILIPEVLQKYTGFNLIGE